MILVDASAMTDLLVGRGPVVQQLGTIVSGSHLHAPQHLPAEVTSAVRGLLMGGHVDDVAAALALDVLDRTRMTLHPFRPLRRRIWELRHNTTVYEAWYLALGEALDTPLVTTDGKLSAVPGTTCTVRVITGS